MTDPRQVLKVLRGARGLILDPHGWWDGNPAGGPIGLCAVIAVMESRCVLDVRIAAYETLGVAMGLPAPLGDVRSIYAWNDSHTHAEVLAAFDRAIATVQQQISPEPTPNADSALDVITACHIAGEIVARHIVAQHPQMDLAEITGLVSAELFYAAQDTAAACDLGVKVERA